MNLARPVGQADVGAVCNVSYAELAANRTLQLGRANWGREGKLPHVGPRWDFPDDLALGLW